MIFEVLRAQVPITSMAPIGLLLKSSAEIATRLGFAVQLVLKACKAGADPLQEIRRDDEVLATYRRVHCGLGDGIPLQCLRYSSPLIVPAAAMIAGFWRQSRSE